MRVAEVKELPPLERFIYWIQERYQLGLRRAAGKPKPWTDDEVLQRYFFTWPYREMDKTTVWFRENVREPLRNDPRVLMATVIFRWFNLIATGEVLRNVAEPFGLLTDWSTKTALRILRPVRDAGSKVFTGAFMINSPGGEPKLEAICRRITNVWDAREMILEKFSRGRFEGKLTLEGSHDMLTEFDGLGGFMAYEIVCDLRYTYLLENAPDKLTWCHVGPGARRGLYRVLGLDFPKGNNAGGCPKLLNDKEEMREMQKLLEQVRKRLPEMPLFELREVEHALCEADKYSRALEGDGRLKRTYERASHAD